jgi:hypothetical protein
MRLDFLTLGFGAHAPSLVMSSMASTAVSEVLPLGSGVVDVDAAPGFVATPDSETARSGAGVAALDAAVDGGGGIGSSSLQAAESWVGSTGLLLVADIYMYECIPSGAGVV